MISMLNSHWFLPPIRGRQVKKKYEKKLKRERNLLCPSLPPLPAKGRSVEEEVRNFNLWNSLKPTITKVHDSLPTLEGKYFSYFFPLFTFTLE